MSYKDSVYMYKYTCCGSFVNIMFIEVVHFSVYHIRAPDIVCKKIILRIFLFISIKFSYLFGYKTGFSLHRMTKNNQVSPMKFCYLMSFTLPKQSLR